MNSSLSLSLELVLLMKWFLENEQIFLKELIEKSIEDGFAQELKLIDNIEEDKLFKNNGKELHETILEFLSFLEESLIDSIEEKELNHKERAKLSPTIQKLSPQNIDKKTILLSIQQTKYEKYVSEKNKSERSAVKRVEKKEIKDLLLSQLLKNWKPKTNEAIN
jgi:hypothetical protein